MGELKNVSVPSFIFRNSNPNIHEKRKGLINLSNFFHFLLDSVQKQNVNGLLYFFVLKQIIYKESLFFFEKDSAYREREIQLPDRYS